MMMQWCDNGSNIDGNNDGDNGDEDSKSCQQGDPTKDQQRWPAGKGGGRGKPGAVSCCHSLHLYNSILQYNRHFQYITAY